MDIRCLFCDDPLGMRAIGSMVVVGNPVAPDAGVLCRRCTALPDRERQRRRDASMTRLLRSAISCDPPPLALPRSRPRWM
jgi:hypothetical protein